VELRRSPVCGFSMECVLMSQTCVNVHAGAKVGQISECIWTCIAACKEYGGHSSNGLCGITTRGLCGGTTILRLLYLTCKLCLGALQ
jgi:hypothetical protein